MAEDVERWLSAEKISHPTLIGHSMGAKVAMTMALRQPTRYSALIPVDNAPVDAALKSDFGQYVKAMKEAEDRRPRIKRQAEADEILAKYEPELAIRQFLLTNLIKVPMQTEEASSSGNGNETELRWRIPLGTLGKSLDNMADFPFKNPDTHQYKGPTLMVRGTQSHYVADETLPVVGSFFPKFELLDIDCGHWVMSEAFEDFRTGVTDFVERVVDEQ
jgi:pimeloyl-ACP methyl ester carboxylesterase